MKRRDLIKSALAGAGAVSAVPGQDAASHAAHAPAATAAAGAKAATAAWKPVLFDAHQNETVTMLADLIIPRTETPGAKDAKVNEFIDFYLSELPVEGRTRFIRGLGWLDGYAIREHSAPFARLKSADQVAVLKTISTGGGPGAEFFRQIKQLTVLGYYTSTMGIDELNRGGRVPGSFGCEHGGKH